MEHSPGTSFEKERGVHAIQVRDDLALATCTSPDKWLLLLKALADNGIPVFHLKLHDSSITFIVRSEYVDRVLNVSAAVPAVTVIEPNVAFVSVVAGAMRDLCLAAGALDIVSRTVLQSELVRARLAL
jgi:aspartokinase